ncbi:HET domain-containing protein [Fusarium keratoplasticum]|uniref:HET domain-containing protein n=1 Tax=Fusarium keratoplasticum TaxID=1328300 RepID=A0ACC0QXC2_9HYPO|nr:HET domain-containing protein [Fusarium keratoplasticum]KAI8668913.1 HET domain-containing protein [Fusarium keratoplasticum]
MPCSICNKFIGVGKLRPEEDAPVGISRKHVPRDLSWQDLQTSAKIFDEEHIESFSIRFFYPNYEDEDAEVDKVVSFLMQDGIFFDIELFATEEDDCPVPDAWESIPVSQRTSSRTDSSDAIEIIKSWIQLCEDDSEQVDCIEPEDPELPKRVVDVGDADGVIRVVETHGESAKYICLSHCWGSTLIITTTQNTLQQRQRGIDMQDLSNAFRDAIFLTRQLGLHYIWIDSLCIIQDSRTDWEIESAKMSFIYSKAFLTIAATHSPDGRGGLYTDTPDFEVSGETPEGEEYRLFFRERIDHHLDPVPEPDRSGADVGLIGHGTIARHPLLTRAWVYQERLLSPRVIHFGPQELFFECLSAMQCECGGIAHDGSSIAPSGLMKLLYAEALFTTAPGVEWHEYAAYYMARIWRTMVNEYTSLGITKPSDRLPAIGGLAKKMSASRKQEYIAGLWGNTLNDDLIWTVLELEGEKKPRYHPLAAPTWSWASVEAHVFYWDSIVFWNPDETETDEDRPPWQHLSRVENWNIDAAGVDEFGHLNGGTIKVTGLAAEGTIERDVGEETKWGSGSYYVRFSPTLRLMMHADYQLDHKGPHQVLPGTEVLCILMSVIQEGPTDHLVSLVLRAVGGSGQFERIVTQTNLYETRKEKTMTMSNEGLMLPTPPNQIRALQEMILMNLRVVYPGSDMEVLLCMESPGVYYACVIHDPLRQNKVLFRGPKGPNLEIPLVGILREVMVLATTRYHL